MKRLRPFFLVIDISFIAYWIAMAFNLIPARFLVKDAHDPILVAWSWSFLPLDLFIAATGLCALWLWRIEWVEWRALALISLVLTSCSGMMAIAFWGMRGDFDLFWWSMNLFLLLYPFAFIPALLRPQETPGLVT